MRYDFRGTLTVKKSRLPAADIAQRAIPIPTNLAPASIGQHFFCAQDGSLLHLRI
jgi:hypothetical protein